MNTPVEFWIVAAEEITNAMREGTANLPEGMVYIRDVQYGAHTDLVLLSSPHAPAEASKRVIEPTFRVHYDGHGRVTHVTVESWGLPTESTG